MKGVINHMTKKDYIKIADVVKESILYKPDDPSYVPIDCDLDSIIRGLCYVFKCDNMRFNADKFKNYINANV